MFLGDFPAAKKKKKEEEKNEKKNAKKEVHNGFGLLPNCIVRIFFFLYCNLGFCIAREELE